MSNNSVPYEILAYPFTAYIAPVGTAFPLVDASPAVDWILIGTSGNLNYDDGEGVKISHSQDMFKFRALGDAGVRKIFRTAEDLMISLKLVDVTLEQYKFAINSNTMTTVAAGGEAGYKKIGLSRGFSVATMALLLRGPSPYGDLMTMQYEVPRAAQGGNPEVTYVKSSAAGLELQWDALVDPNATSTDERFGRLVAQTAAAIS